MIVSPVVSPIVYPADKISLGIHDGVIPTPSINWRLDKGEVPNLTFTRASKAWGTVGGVLTEFAVNKPRLLGADGFLIEGARITLTPKSRRLDDAAVWTATNVTTSAVAGAEGAAGTATRIVATANDATILGGTNTAASAERRFSPYVRRVAGTGELRWTLDGGSTYTALTGITSAFARMDVGQTVENPQVGFQIQTSGDEFDIDFANGETGAFRSSPIESGDSNATRAADVVTISDVSWLKEGPGTVLLAFDPGQAASVEARGLEIFSGGASGTVITQLYGNVIRALVGADGAAGYQALTPNALNKYVFAYDTNDLRGCLNGVLGAPDNSVTLPTGFTSMSIGGKTGSSSLYLFGNILYLIYFPTRLPNEILRGLTA